VQKAIMVMGPQAGGKSTYVRKIRDERPCYRAISADLWFPRDEDTGQLYWVDSDGHKCDWGLKPMDAAILARAWQWVMDQIREGVAKGEHIIIEGTLVTEARRREVLLPFQGQGYTVAGVFLMPTLLECARRNEARRDRVPDTVLARTYSRIEIPTLGEGFSCLQMLNGAI